MDLLWALVKDVLLRCMQAGSRFRRLADVRGWWAGTVNVCVIAFLFVHKPQSLAREKKCA